MMTWWCSIHYFCKKSRDVAIARKQSIWNCKYILVEVITERRENKKPVSLNSSVRFCRGELHSVQQRAGLQRPYLAVETRKARPRREMMGKPTLCLSDRETSRWHQMFFRHVFFYCQGHDSLIIMPAKRVGSGRVRIWLGRAGSTQIWRGPNYHNLEENPGRPEVDLN